MSTSRIPANLHLAPTPCPATRPPTSDASRQLACALSLAVKCRRYLPARHPARANIEAAILSLVDDVQGRIEKERQK